MGNWFRTALVCVVTMLFSLEISVGQEAAKKETEQPINQSKEDVEMYRLLKSYYRNKAQQYHFALDAQGKEMLTLQPVAMTWTGFDYQSVSNTVSANSGDVYIWTYQGRAVVAGGVGSFPVLGRWNFFHEFHVLSERAPQPTAINAIPDMVWRPQGVEPKLIPAAAAPVDDQRRRLTQMRQLAREFSGATVKPDNSGNVPLRLITTPIYRLDANELAKGDHGIVDGAVFVFTGQDGTDPEMLLSIECRKSDGILEWTYVPAAMTYVEMWMKYKEIEVWRIPNFRVDPGKHHYFTNIVESVTSLEELQAYLDSANAKK